MAAALAVRIAVIALAAILLAGTSRIQPAHAQSIGITLSVDHYLLNVCDSVTFTIVFSVSGGTGNFRLQEFDAAGEANELKKWLNVPNGTFTYVHQTCAPERLLYRAVQITSGATEYSNSIVVQWLHPAEGGTDRLRMVSDGGVYTSVAPVITGFDYEKPEAVTSNGAVSYDASVLVKWSPVARATGYEIVANSPTEEVIRDTTDSEAASTQAEIEFTDIYPNDEQDVQATFQVRAFLDNGESSPVILDTGSGRVAVNAGAKAYSPLSEMASIIVRRAGNAAPIDTTTAGDPSIVAPGAAPEGITEVARLIAEQTGMGAGAATTLLPLLCLLLAGGAAAVVVLPLGFSPLSLAAGFVVFTLVWSVGGVAWFGLPIAVAALPPVLLAASGVMIVRRKGMFG